MILASGSTDYAAGNLGMIELVASYCDDREFRKFSRAEIRQYINLGQLDVALEINTLNKEFFLVRDHVDTVAGQAQYDLPLDCARLMGIDIADSESDTDPEQIVSTRLSDRAFYERLDSAQSKDQFRFFFVSGTRRIDLQPAPATSGLKIRVHKIKRVAELTDNNEESEIPVEHHELVVFQAVRRCWLKKGKIHAAVEGLYNEGLDRMKRNLTQFDGPVREDRIEPFYGSYGIDPNFIGGFGRTL